MALSPKQLSYVVIFFVVPIVLIILCLVCYVSIIKPKLYVVTVVTDINNENFLRLQNSAMLCNLNFVPLVSKIQIGHGKGFGMKIKLLNDFISTIRGHDIVVFVDGYDVLLTGTEEQIVAEYNRICGKRKCAVFSAEYYCWPDGNIAEQYPKVENTPYRYLNSGTYISNVSTLRHLIKYGGVNFDDPKSSSIDDQRFFTSLFLSLRDKNLIKLDNFNRIFNCMVGGLDDLEISNGKWYNKVTKSFPLIFHANGGPDVKNFLFTKIYPYV